MGEVPVAMANQPQLTPEIGKVEGIKYPGDGFMSAIFHLEIGQTAS